MWRALVAGAAALEEGTGAASGMAGNPEQGFGDLPWFNEAVECEHGSQCIHRLPVNPGCHILATPKPRPLRATGSDSYFARRWHSW